MSSIFEMTPAQKKNMVYNVNPDLKKGFIDAARNGQVRMALEYMAFIFENWVEDDKPEDKPSIEMPKKRTAKTVEETVSEVE